MFGFWTDFSVRNPKQKCSDYVQIYTTEHLELVQNQNVPNPNYVVVQISDIDFMDTFQCYKALKKLIYVQISHTVRNS